MFYKCCTVYLNSLAIVGPTTIPRDLEAENLSRSTSSLDLTDVDLMPDAYSDKNVIRTKTFLFVADLSHKGSRFHGKKSQLYMWNLLIVGFKNFDKERIFTYFCIFLTRAQVAVFYALPVLQLVIIYQKVIYHFYYLYHSINCLYFFRMQVLNDTGDQDLCYFNFLCAHPLGDLTDFNHVYSNLGYVLLGLLFIINTARRDVLRRQAQANHDRLEKVNIVCEYQMSSPVVSCFILQYYGIPQHYGLFYAMGTALMVLISLLPIYWLSYFKKYVW